MAKTTFTLAQRVREVMPDVLTAYPHARVEVHTARAAAEALAGGGAEDGCSGLQARRPVSGIDPAPGGFLDTVGVAATMERLVY